MIMMMVFIPFILEGELCFVCPLQQEQTTVGQSSNQSWPGFLQGEKSLPAFICYSFSNFSTTTTSQILLLHLTLALS